MWRELIQRLDAEAEFHPPATLEQVQAVEASLGVTLPAELRDLLLETNGAEVSYGTGLVWSTEAITRRNQEMRREWQRGDWVGTMPIDHLVFFGDLGNGDLCFSRSPWNGFWKGSRTASSGGTMKTIAGSVLPFRSLTVCVERGTPSRVYLTDQMGCVRLVPE